MRGMNPLALLLGTFFTGWLMLVVAWAIFRKPDVPFFTVALRVWAPGDYLTERGVVLYAVGSTVCLGSWLLAFLVMTR
jgi:hypothetical protein